MVKPEMSERPDRYRHPQVLIDFLQAEVAKLRNALERIADENDPLEGIGSEMDFAQRILRELDAN